MKILFSKYISKDRLRFVFIGLALLIGFLVVVYADIFITHSLEYYYITPEEYDDIISMRQEVSSPLIEELYFNTFKLIKDQKSGNWFYSIVEGDTKAYNPKISFKKKLSVQVASLQKKIETSDVRNNIPLKFIAYDNNSYFIFNVTCTTLPILSVDDTRMYLFDNRAGVDGREFSTYSQIYIRGRGNTQFSKKGYTLKLKTYSPGKNKRKFKKSLLGMPVRSKWHLHHSYTDEEKIKQAFCAKLWQECCSTDNLFNLDDGNEYKFVELFMNGTYMGLYDLGYPIDKNSMELVPGEYIYKKSTVEGDFRVVAGTPKTSNLDVIHNYLSLLESNQSRESISKLYTIIDMENAVDYWLFVNFTQNMDNDVWGKLNNMIITKKFVDTKGNYKLIFTPWDFDFTWGDSVNWVEGTRYRVKTKYFTPKENMIIHKHVVYYLLTNRDKYIKRLIKDRYAKLRQTAWSIDNLISIINNYEKDIFDSGVYLREKIVWPNGWYLEDVNVKTSLLKKQVVERANYFDQYVDEITEE